jgi:glycosyltransferase involved in cell wall biosynthesis
MITPKVCIFTETYFPVVGGGETQARLLAEGLVANGFSVIILTRRSDPSLKKTEQWGAVTAYRLPPVGSGQLRKWGLLLTSLPALVSLRHQYDLVFVSGFRRVGIAAVLISKLLDKGCILKADSLGEMSGDYFATGLARLRLRSAPPVFEPFLWLRDNILKRANAFVAISSEVDTELRTQGVNPALIKMIPNSVDTRRFRPAKPQTRDELRQKLGIPARDKIVIFTGRLVSYKGLPLLLRVWRDIQRNHEGVGLLLVGSGGQDIHNCEAELKEYVSAYGLKDSVHFTGGVQNVHEYLQASDIFVFPTENEAFGISLIEAMACGLPVISTNVGGVKDILQNQQNGVAVQPGDFQGLYDALDALITDSSLSARLGRAAWQTVQNKYSAETVTQQYAKLFRRISNSIGEGPAPDRPGSSELA